MNINQILQGHQTAEARWARFGPYYAMFPVDFAFNVIERYSQKGDYILDPFAGRCSSVYAGGILGRNSLGIEINPVGWLYGFVKINPAGKNKVIKRLHEVYQKRNEHNEESKKMPKFYHICYCDEVLKFLLSARANLQWSKNKVDATLMAILLIHLHAKLGEGLSNQMRMTKSMGMNYSIQWWKKNNLLTPPNINPYDFIIRKIEWRYGKGKPNIKNSKVIFGDSSIKLKTVIKKTTKNNTEYSLLFTSPPYYSITNYHADQWLRLWLLGGDNTPKSVKGKHKGRFGNKQEYYDLLNNVFELSSKIMDENCTVYVRTDKRKFTFETTLEILQKYFPQHKVQIIKKPLKKDTKTQTKLFGDDSMKPGEVDIILTRCLISR
jgi:DNA modification methylase